MILYFTEAAADGCRGKGVAISAVEIGKVVAR
jgi:hypothetical protein